jgi:hypothetical protein
MIPPAVNGPLHEEAITAGKGSRSADFSTFLHEYAPLPYRPSAHPTCIDQGHMRAQKTQRVMTAMLKMKKIDIAELKRAAAG